MNEYQPKRVRIFVIEGQVAPEVKPAALIPGIIEDLLQVQMVASADIEVIATDNEVEAAQGVMAQIVEQFEEYDGFVVVQDHFHAIFTANVLTFMADELGKPVVFTGIHANQPAIQDPIAYATLGLQTNVLTALQISTLECQGVLLAYGPNMVRPTKAIGQADFSVNSFGSIQDEPIAMVQFGVHVPAANKLRTGILEANVAVNDNVLVLTHQPNLPFSDPRFADVPVFIVRQADEFIQPLLTDVPNDRLVIIYGAGVDQHLRENVIFMNAITLPALISKAMVAAGRHPGDIPAMIEYLMHEQHSEFLQP